MMKPDFTSIRFRLTAWYAAVMAVTVVLLASSLWFFVRASFHRQLDGRLESELGVVEKFLRENPQELDEIEEHGGMFLFEVAQDGRIIRRAKGWTQIGLPDINVPPAQHLSSWKAGDQQYFLLGTSVIESEGSKYVVTVAEDKSLVGSSLRTLATALLAGLPCVLALAVVGGWLLATRALAPIDKMATKASQISADRLHERLPIENPRDELGRLATVFNETLTRLEDAFDQLRRFTADASHELRTPLTALRSVGEVGLRKGSDPADVIGSMLEETDKLALLVDNLLMLARADAGHLKLHAERADLASLVDEVVDWVRVLAEEKRQSLDIEVRQPVTASVDRTTIRQAMLNLLDNAIRYTPENGHIVVTIGRTAKGEAYIAVTDNGPGIAVEHHERVFERFYRVDKERSHTLGGTGLGLAIARKAVESNGGRIELESELGKGSTFRIILSLQNQANS
jgi:heavy metal sensor kinase